MTIFKTCIPVLSKLRKTKLKFRHLKKIAPQKTEFPILRLKKGEKLINFGNLCFLNFFLDSKLPEMTSDNYIYFEHI